MKKSSDLWLPQCGLQELKMKIIKELINNVNLEFLRSISVSKYCKTSRTQELLQKVFFKLFLLFQIMGPKPHSAK